jgi:hypothetical protein
MRAEEVAGDEVLAEMDDKDRTRIWDETES